MTTVGLRELRQDASELVRRVQAGEEIEITVSGRPAARLVPVAPRRWVSGAALQDLWRGPALQGWDEDMAKIDGDLVDPFSR